MGTAMPRPQALDVSQGALLEATGTDGPHEQRIRELQSQASATIRRGENERVFIISQQSERDLALTFGLRAYAEMLGALTLFGMRNGCRGSRPKRGRSNSGRQSPPPSTR
jgi:hypothetical protein